MVKKITYKPKKSDKWEEVVECLINNHKLKVSFFPSDGDIFIPITDDYGWSLVIKKDGTWSLQ